MVASHKKNISDMAGLGRQMPLTMTAFAIGAISIIGLPPMAGTWSKWFLTLGAIDADKLVIVAVLMISSLLNIAYLLPIPIKAFFSSPNGSKQVASGAQAWSWKETKEAPLACLLAIGVTSICCVALFFYPNPFVELINTIPGVSTDIPDLSTGLTPLTEPSANAAATSVDTSDSALLFESSLVSGGV